MNARIVCGGVPSWDTFRRFHQSTFFVGTTSYFIRRLLLIIPTFIGITLLVFAVTRVVPGGPIERMLTDALMSSAGRGAGSSQSVASTMLSDAQLDQLRVYYGLDKPVFLGYVIGSAKCCASISGARRATTSPSGTRSNGVFRSRFSSASPHLILTYSICIPLGIWKAIRHRTLFDNVSSGFVFLGLRDSRLCRRHRAAHVLCLAARLVSARRIRQRQLRAVERVGPDTRRAPPRHVATLVVHGGQLRRHDIRDEELADGQSLRGLRPHRHRERVVVSTRRFRPCSPQQPHSNRDVVRQQHRRDPCRLLSHRAHLQHRWLRAPWLRVARRTGLPGRARNSRHLVAAVS